MITAFQNVADTLHAIQSDADALSANVESEQAAKKVLTITQKQHQLGYVNALTLLTAEETYQQALVALLQARTNRYGDTAALYQALGGGWWNRSENVSITTNEQMQAKNKTSAATSTEVMVSTPSTRKDNP